jgi:RNase H-fold protein (predicted Holliday junction resolvase)
MDREESARAASVRRFTARLGERFPELEIELHDERLTTKEAEALLREEGYRGREIAARKDSWSALVLLRDWLASRESPPPPREAGPWEAGR